MEFTTLLLARPPPTASLCLPSLTRRLANSSTPSPLLASRRPTCSRTVRATLPQIEKATESGACPPSRRALLLSLSSTALAATGTLTVATPLSGLQAALAAPVEEAAKDLAPQVTALAAPTAGAPTAAAEAAAVAAPVTEFTTFSNTADCFSLQVPQGWEKGDATLGTRKLVAFHPPHTTTANVSMLLTPLGADFTGLGSFGTVDAFGESLVNSQDRSYLRKPGQKAVLLDTKSTGDVYYVEYTIQKPGETKVHLLSAVAVHFNGIYNQLYTLTAQYLEDDAASYDSTLRQVVKSFKISK